MFLLDTDICSYLMKRRFPALVEKVRGFAPGELKVSVVTVYELEFGARRSAKQGIRRIIRAFLDHVEILPLDPSVAREAAEIRAHLAASGSMIGAYDLLIAGHARSLGAVLVTNNVREFSRVEDLRFENWTVAD